MAEKVLINDKAVSKEDTKIKFGAINSPTPSSWKWVFRATAIFTTVVAFYIGGTTLIQEQYKVEVLLALKSLDMLTLGFSKLFGVVEDK